MVDNRAAYSKEGEGAEVFSLTGVEPTSGFNKTEITGGDEIFSQRKGQGHRAYESTDKSLNEIMILRDEAVTLDGAPMRSKCPAFIIQSVLRRNLTFLHSILPANRLLSMCRFAAAFSESYSEVSEKSCVKTNTFWSARAPTECHN